MNAVLHYNSVDELIFIEDGDDEILGLYLRRRACSRETTQRPQKNTISEPKRGRRSKHRSGHNAEAPK